MKNARAFLIAVVLCAMALVAPVIAYAAPEPQVSAQLTSDKDAYQAGDTAKLELSISNNGTNAISDVKYRFELPDGIQLAEGSALEGAVGSIDAQGSAVASIQVAIPSSQNPGGGDGSDSGNPPSDEGNQPDGGSDVPPQGDGSDSGTPSEDDGSDSGNPPQDDGAGSDTSTSGDGGNSGDGNGEPSSGGNGENAADGKSGSEGGMADAGDNALPLILGLAIVAVGAGAAVFAYRKSRKTPAVFGCILLAVLLGTGTAIPLAQAAENTQSVTCEKAISVDGQQCAIKAIVTYVPSDASDEPSTEEPASITRGEWIAKLLEAAGTGNFEEDPAANAACPFTDIEQNLYAAQIKTAYALGSLPDDVSNQTTFAPDQPATRDFMLSTAVLHAGFFDDGSKLQASDASSAVHPSLLQIAIDQGFAELDADNAIRPLDNATVDEADAVAGKVAENGFDADAPAGGDPVVEYELQDGVMLLDECQQVDESHFVLDIPYDDTKNSADQQSALLNAQRAARAPFQFPGVNSKVAFLGNTEGDEGFAGTVTHLEPYNNGLQTRFEYKQASKPEEIYNKIEVTASGEGDRLANVEPVDGATILPANGSSAAQQGRAIDINDDGFVVSFEDLKIEDAGSVSGSVTIVPSIDVDFDWEFPATVNRARAVVNLDTTVNVKADFDGVDATVDLLKRPITVPIAAGANVAFDLKLHIKADGSAELNVVFVQKIGARYKNGSFQKVAKTTVDDEQTNCAVKAEFELGAVPIVQLRFTKIELFDISAEVGGAGSGKAVTRTSGVTCIDADAHMYGSISVGKNTAWMKWANLTYTKNVWTKGSTPFEASWHFETTGEGGSLELVDTCTQDDESSSLITPDGNFIYKVKKDGVHIESYEGEDTEVVIPAYIDDEPVVYVHLGVTHRLAGIFSKANYVKSVSLEEGSKLTGFILMAEGEKTDADHFEYYLNKLDLRNSDDLEVIDVNNDRPVELLINDSPNLKNIEALPINNLDLSKCGNLETAILNRNQYELLAEPITELRLGYHPFLEELYVDYMEISELDLDYCISFATPFHTALPHRSTVD